MDDKGSTDGDRQRFEGWPQDDARAVAKERFERLIGELRARLPTWEHVAKALHVNRVTLQRWRSGKGVRDFSKINTLLEETLKTGAIPPPPIRGVDQTLHTEDGAHSIVTGLSKMLASAHEARTAKLPRQALDLFSHAKAMAIEFEKVCPKGTLLAAKLRACIGASWAGLRHFHKADRCYSEAQTQMLQLDEHVEAYRYGHLSQTWLAAKFMWIAHRRHSRLVPKYKMRAHLLDCYGFVADEEPPAGATVATKKQRYGILLTLTAALNEKEEFLKWGERMLQDPEVYADIEDAKQAIRDIVSVNEDGEFAIAQRCGWVNQLRSWKSCN